LLPSQNGALGVRGDIRIGGRRVDGDSGTLAFTYLPEFGSDMVIDTGDDDFYTDATDNFVGFRNTLMHELGHSIGLLHVESSSALLLEPYIDTSFDGPQLDDIRGAQFFYGDAYEKSNGGLGNGTAALATDLGVFAAGGVHRIGADADLPGQAISASATDFVSIANLSDVDFYQFTIERPAALNATLVPRGGLFTQAEEGFTPTSFNANARNNLELTLFDANGASILATADTSPIGEPELISQLLLPSAGTYYARVAGADDTIQLYDLTLSALALGNADYNGDGFVNAADYTVWRNALGETVAIATSADGSGPDGFPDGIIDEFDYSYWKAHYGDSAGSGSSVSADLSDPASVPEPNTMITLAIGLLTFFAAARRR
jgi:hypothetical protein